jgi:hypothetical protein
MCETNPSSNKQPVQPVTSPSFSLGTPVYVCYKDHVLFKNIEQPIADAIERETIGWLSKQTDEIMIIEHDRTLPDARITSGRGSGIIVLKSCIIEIRELPLQKSSNCILNPTKPTSKAEYALRTTKRKTPNCSNQEQTNCKQ